MAPDDLSPTASAHVFRLAGRAGSVFVMPSSSCRGRHRFVVPSCYDVLLPFPYCRSGAPSCHAVIVLPLTPSYCVVLLCRRCHLLKEQLDASCSVAALYYLLSLCRRLGVWPQSTRKCCIVLPDRRCRRGLSAHGREQQYKP
jgi:hypothetical protein